MILTEMIAARGKIDTFPKKISLWQKRMAEGDLQLFINFDEYKGEKDFNWHVVSIIQQHLQSLAEFFFITQVKILGMGIWNMEYGNMEYGNMEWKMEICGLYIHLQLTSKKAN